MRLCAVSLQLVFYYCFTVHTEVSNLKGLRDQAGGVVVGAPGDRVVLTDHSRVRVCVWGVADSDRLICTIMRFDSARELERSNNTQTKNAAEQMHITNASTNHISYKNNHVGG